MPFYGGRHRLECRSMVVGIVYNAVLWWSASFRMPFYGGWEQHRLRMPLHLHTVVFLTWNGPAACIEVVVKLHAR